jgi:hypothetical protein
VASGVLPPPYCRRTAAVLPPYCRRTATVLPLYCRRTAAVPPPYCRRTAAVLPPYCRRTAGADTATPHLLRLAPPRAIQSSCIHTPYKLAGRHRAQGVLLVCFAAAAAAGASVASASNEGIVEIVVQCSAVHNVFYELLLSYFTFVN